MTFTIEQLKEMRSKITSGDRYLHEDDWGDLCVVNDDGRYMTWGDQLVVKIEAGHMKHDGESIVAIPALLDQLIATETKLQKVLKSIEGLRTECLDVVFHEGSGHEEYTGNEVAELIEEAHYKALTQILEGNDD